MLTNVIPQINTVKTANKVPKIFLLEEFIFFIKQVYRFTNPVAKLELLFQFMYTYVVMSKDFLLFDLDGTLTDPAQGITNSLMHALHEYGIEECDRRKLYKYIGPPLMDTFMNDYGFSKEQAAEAVIKYRDYFAVDGIFENIVYHGIPEMLRTLQTTGKTLILATSKPEEYSVRILKHFNLDRYFTCIAGSLMDETRSKKSEVIEYALDKCGVPDKSQAIMIGDREYDITGAKECGLASVGVTYGFGTRNELEKAGADFIADSVDALQNILLIDAQTE